MSAKARFNEACAAAKAGDADALNGLAGAAAEFLTESRGVHEAAEELIGAKVGEFRVVTLPPTAKDPEPVLERIADSLERITKLLERADERAWLESAR